MSRPPFTWAGSFYVNVFRGMPALVTVLWVYFGVSIFLGINFTVFQAGVIALTLLYSAFISEIYRAALEAVPRGQREAGLALGLGKTRTFVKVILPQATKIAIPNIGSMFIGMVKDTSVFTVIGLLEITRVVAAGELALLPGIRLLHSRRAHLRRHSVHAGFPLPRRSNASSRRRRRAGSRGPPRHGSGGGSSWSSSAWKQCPVPDETSPQAQ